MSPHVTEARRIVGERRFTPARAWVERHCMMDGGTLYTSEDYPRVLEVLGVVVRRGAGMFGHAHELGGTALGSAVLNELVQLALYGMGYDERFELLQRDPGILVRHRPLCVREGRRWQRTLFGDMVAYAIGTEGLVCSRWTRNAKPAPVPEDNRYYPCNYCNDTGSYEDAGGFSHRCDYCGP